MSAGRAGKGILPSTIRRISDGFYIGWATRVAIGAGRSWVLRMLSPIDRLGKTVKICGHHVAPAPDQDYEAMVPLTHEESGTKLNCYYHIPRAAEASPSSTLPEVAAAPPGAADTIQPDSACWSLGLLRRGPILEKRSKAYEVGKMLGKGAHGQVFHLTFKGSPGTRLCAKMLRCDDSTQRNTRTEVYAMERCNACPAGFVRLLDVFVKGSLLKSPTRYVYMVMEKWEMELAAFIAKAAPTPLQIRSALHGPLQGLRFLHDHLLLVHCDVASKNIFVNMGMVAAVQDIVAVLGDLGAVREVCNARLPFVYFSGGAGDSAQKHIYRWVGVFVVRVWAGGVGKG